MPKLPVIPNVSVSFSPILRTSEAASYLKVQPTTLEQWRWSGRGPRFAKIGRNVRYRLSDLDAFMQERVFTSTTEAKERSLRKDNI